jgi:hypothetical protein
MALGAAGMVLAGMLLGAMDEAEAGVLQGNGA